MLFDRFSSHKPLYCKAELSLDMAYNVLHDLLNYPVLLSCPAPHLQPSPHPYLLITLHFTHSSISHHWYITHLPLSSLSPHTFFLPCRAQIRHHWLQGRIWRLQCPSPVWLALPVLIPFTASHYCTHLALDKPSLETEKIQSLELSPLYLHCLAWCSTYSGHLISVALMNESRKQWNAVEGEEGRILLHNLGRQSSVLVWEDNCSPDSTDMAATHWVVSIAAGAQSQSHFRLVIFTLCNGYRLHPKSWKMGVVCHREICEKMWLLGTTPGCPHHGNKTVDSIKGRHHPGVGNPAEFGWYAGNRSWFLLILELTGLWPCIPKLGQIEIPQFLLNIFLYPSSVLICNLSFLYVSVPGST